MVYCCSNWILLMGIMTVLSMVGLYRLCAVYRPPGTRESTVVCPHTADVDLSLFSGGSKHISMQLTSDTVNLHSWQKTRWWGRGDCDGNGDRRTWWGNKRHQPTRAWIKGRWLTKKSTYQVYRHIFNHRPYTSDYICREIPLNKSSVSINISKISDRNQFIWVISSWRWSQSVLSFFVQ